MSICPCGYWWADCDEEGTPISQEYCHYEGPAEWAPCEQNEAYDYEEEYEEFEAEEEAYAEWLAAEAQRELEEEYHNELYGEPYDYAEF